MAERGLVSSGMPAAASEEADEAPLLANGWMDASGGSSSPEDGLIGANLGNTKVSSSTTDTTHHHHHHSPPPPQTTTTNASLRLRAGVACRGPMLTGTGLRPGTQASQGGASRGASSG